jgi:hypothetical protein
VAVAFDASVIAGEFADPMMMKDVGSLPVGQTRTLEHLV